MVNENLIELAKEAEGLVDQTGLPTAPATLSMKEAYSLAEAFHKSGLFRDTKSLAQATVKILAGYELGIGPFAAMRGINIIQGQLAPNAAITAALIKKDPKFNYTVDASTDKKCAITFHELFGAEWKVLGTNEWTMQDAERAGLTNKDNWKKYPRDMLYARALTQGARQHCPHIFMGSVYTPEELNAPAPPDIIESVLEVAWRPEQVDTVLAITYIDEDVAAISFLNYSGFTPDATVEEIKSYAHAFQGAKDQDMETKEAIEYAKENWNK